VKENLTVRLAPTMLDDLRRIAKDRDVSIANVIRELLRGALPPKARVTCEGHGLRLAEMGMRPVTIHAP
jgi:hypothetical protein